MSDTADKEPNDKTEIDLRAKKTEVEWSKTIDNFWKRAAPLWFQWLEWLLILGAVGYLAKQTKSVIVMIIVGLSHAAFFLYLQAQFYSLEFHGLPLVKTEKTRRTISLILSAILSLTLWLLFTSVMSEIQKSP